MPHYYFDIRDGEALSVDEEGMDLADQRGAEMEAALSLADAAGGLAPLADIRDVAVEVRGIEGPIFRASFLFDIARLGN